MALALETYKEKAMRPASFLAISLILLACEFASAEVVFTDGFETGPSNWVNPYPALPPPPPSFVPFPYWSDEGSWFDVNWAGPKPMCGHGETYNCFGPHVFNTSTDHPHSGAYCVKQINAQPFWYGITLTQKLTLPSNKTIRLSAWQFEDCNHLDPYPQSWNVSHDQDEGWVALIGDDGPAGSIVYDAEFAAIGVHAPPPNPTPIWSYNADFWHNLTWSTATESWNLTGPVVPRTQGFRHLEIWVHPYTGNVGDVEFFVNGTKVAQGIRKPGYLGTGVPINNIGLGANPAHMSEDYIANTYDYFYYDDVKLSVGALGDFDGDGDVDLIDFGHFQACFNGPNRPPVTAGCEDADFDSDNDVDLMDFGVFQGCFNGPNRPAQSACQ